MDPLFNWLKDHYDMKGNVALGWVLAIAGASLISALAAALVSENIFSSSKYTFPVPNSFYSSLNTWCVLAASANIFKTVDI